MLENTVPDANMNSRASLSNTLLGDTRAHVMKSANDVSAGTRGRIDSRNDECLSELVLNALLRDIRKPFIL